MAVNRQPVLKRCRTLGINPATMGIDKSSNKKKAVRIRSAAE
jgi:small subunit ribosomal protein S4